jgi:Transposase DDE domain/Transposase domain (DUF772)
MAVGRAQNQILFDDAAALLGDRLPVGSVYHLLAGQGQRLFGDDYFADLFTNSAKGRPTIPARVVATVMLLQAYEGLSDREAVEHLTFDLRWKAAAGLAVDADAFHPTVLVGMRNRLRASARPRRLHEDVRAVARSAGLLRGGKRVVDSTPLFDAVATQDTVTQLRAAVRTLLRLADRHDRALAAGVRRVLTRDDDYATPGKPSCDWDEAAARDALVDALVRDCLAALDVLHGRQLPRPVAEAAELLALVAGQDVEPAGDGAFRIARRVARDRIISTVDTAARHGRKSRHRTFDGYKAHLAVDPDDELIDEVAVTAANVADRDAVADLLPDTDHHDGDGGHHDGDPPEQAGPDRQPTADDRTTPPAGWEVFGDSAYADAATLDRLTDAGHTVHAKVPPTRNSRGLFSKDRFAIDLAAGTATCPAGNTAPITPAAAGGGRASFKAYCGQCPLRAQCTTSTSGRSIAIHPREATLQTARATQRDPAWQAAYRANRPTVERKIAHFVRRAWGGRNARCRGTTRVLTDLLTRAAALNLARLAALGLHHPPTGWALTPAG